jgi:hypothetical protein
MILSLSAFHASAQSTAVPSASDCSTGSASSNTACQNQVSRPNTINNNLQTPVQPTTPAVGVQGGGGIGVGGTSGGAVGGTSGGGSTSGGLGGTGSNGN